MQINKAHLPLAAECANRNDQVYVYLSSTTIRKLQSNRIGNGRKCLLSFQTQSATLKAHAVSENQPLLLTDLRN